MTINDNDDSTMCVSMWFGFFGELFDLKKIVKYEKEM